MRKVVRGGFRRGRFCAGRSRFAASAASLRTRRPATAAGTLARAPPFADLPYPSADRWLGRLRRVRVCRLPLFRPVDPAGRAARGATRRAAVLDDRDCVRSLFGGCRARCRDRFETGGAGDDRGDRDRGGAGLFPARYRTDLTGHLGARNRGLDPGHDRDARSAGQGGAPPDRAHRHEPAGDSRRRARDRLAAQPCPRCPPPRHRALVRRSACAQPARAGVAEHGSGGGVVFARTPPRVGAGSQGRQRPGRNCR